MRIIGSADNRLRFIRPPVDMASKHVLKRSQIDWTHYKGAGQYGLDGEPARDDVRDRGAASANH
jgi:hypothetical protein